MRGMAVRTVIRGFARNRVLTGYALQGLAVLVYTWAHTVVEQAMMDQLEGGAPSGLDGDASPGTGVEQAPTSADHRNHMHASMSFEQLVAAADAAGEPVVVPEGTVVDVD